MSENPIKNDKEEEADRIIAKLKTPPPQRLRPCWSFGIAGEEEITKEEAEAIKELAAEIAREIDEEVLKELKNGS
jgi:hypothetical protein